MDAIDDLYQEAMFLSDMFDIPRIIVHDYFMAFVDFGREEINKRMKMGMVNNVIDPDMLFDVIMSEANIL